jgi:hypothetical protein
MGFAGVQRGDGRRQDGGEHVPAVAKTVPVHVPNRFRTGAELCSAPVRRSAYAVSRP